MTKARASRTKMRQTALVTGASSGIGEAFAQRLAREKFDLVIVARTRSRLESLAKLIRDAEDVEVEVVAADLTHTADLHALEKRIRSEAPIDMLVNNAGFGTKGQFSKLDLAKEEEEIRLNVMALVRLTHAALPGMIARNRGSVINVSSMAGLQPNPYFATYGATKAFVNSFTEALYEELRGTDVRIQALCPGFTRTEFQERAGIDTSRLPSLLWMTPEAVVDASLAGLRSSEVVCVPGFSNRVVSTMVGAVPRGVTRRFAGSVFRRFLA